MTAKKIMPVEVVPNKATPKKVEPKKTAPKKQISPIKPAVPASIQSVGPVVAAVPTEQLVPTSAPAPEPLLPPTSLSPISPAPNVPAQPLSTGDERTWGLLAHLSVLLNPFTGLGPIVAFILYLIYKDRSRYVAYHALQSAIFQMIWWFGAGVLIGIMWAIVGVLSALIIGVILIPFAVPATLILTLLPVGALIYGIVGAVKVNQGQDFKYWLVGDWVRGTLTG